MLDDFCRVTITGRLLRDPRMWFSSAGVPVATTLLAYLLPGDEAFFVIVLATHDRAQQACRNLAAGMRVLVHGSLRPNSYVVADGTEHLAVSVVADGLHVLSSETATEDRFDWDPDELDQAMSLNDQEWLDWFVRVAESSAAPPRGNA